MPVLKIVKTQDYTVMSNYHLREKAMSLKAKGLLSVMLSLPENWDYSIKGLEMICLEGESAIESTLKELKEFGYLEVKKIMPNESKSGRIEYEYYVYEMPIDTKQGVEKQGVENHPLVSHDNIKLIKEQNTNILNTNVNIKEIEKEKIYKKEKEKEKIVQFEIEFDTLWKQYPNKKGKAKALEQYIKARTNGATFEEIQQGLHNYLIYCRDTEWYTPKDGSTWFNAKSKCWEDVYNTNTRNSEKQERKNILDQMDLSDFFN